MKARLRRTRVRAVVGDVSPARAVTLADLAPTLAELVGMPWPTSHAGAPIAEALLPRARRASVPRLVVVVVWDGGWDVLNQWPHQWPAVKRLISGGVSVGGVTWAPPPR